MEAVSEVNMEALRAIIADAIDVDEEVLLEDAHFITDIGVDSLSSLEVLVRLEKEFKIKIPEGDLVRLYSLRAVADYLNEVMPK